MPPQRPDILQRGRQRFNQLPLGGKIGVVVVLLLICVGLFAGIGAVGGGNQPTATATVGTQAQAPTKAATATSLPRPTPTATPIPASPTAKPTTVPPTATPTPQAPMLGGLKASYDAKFGKGVYSSGDLAWEYHYDSPNDSRVLWLTLDGAVSDPNKARVVHIELGVTETWNDQTAATHCNAFLPPDAHLQQTVPVPGGSDYEKAYLSQTEASLFTPDYFTDRNNKQVTPGTIYVQFFHDGTSHITGCTLGLGTNV